MSRLVYFGVFVIFLGTVGCSSDEERSKTTEAAVNPTTISPPSPHPPAPVVEQQAKPNPAAAETPAEALKPTPAPAPVVFSSGRANPARTYKVRAVVTEPVEPATAVDSRSEKLATALLGLSLEDRLKWKQQEFARRGIGDVRDDK
jgi:hypothetical protein